MIFRPARCASSLRNALPGGVSLERGCLRRSWSLPVCETDPVAPLSPYGYHKRNRVLVEEFAPSMRCGRSRSASFPRMAPVSAAGRLGHLRARDYDCRLLLHGTGAESRDFVMPPISPAGW